MSEVDPRAERTGLPGALPLLALGLAAVLVAVGGAVGVSMAMAEGSHGLMWGGAPIARATAPPASVSAGFELDGLPRATVSQYTFARENADAYAGIPCFCGCADMLGHRNLAQCFVTPDGAWESHAAGCEVCLAESRMVMRMMGRGTGPPMMRDRIVAEFGGPAVGPMGTTIEEG